MNLKRIWNFYWKDNSLLSYAFFIIVTYVAFKFVLFPAFLFITGLSDIVAIMSNSMEHSGFEEYYFYDYFNTINFTNAQINNLAYSDGLNVGDVILVKPMDSYEVGDVIVFISPFYPEKLVHRIVSTDPLMTKGDNNPISYTFDKNISNIIGEAVFRIPYLGLPRFWLYQLIGI